MHSAPVSVVIPTYNRRHLIPEAIDSVLSQTLPPAEIIVIDDGSRDETGERIRAYGSRVVYRYQANQGLSAARNHGIRSSTQPFVALLDDDDVWHPQKIELQMRCFERRPEVAMLGARQFDWPACAFPQMPRDPLSHLVEATWAQLVVRTFIPVSSVVVRRELFDRVGMFDTSLTSSEDRDFFLRAARAAPIGMLNVPLSGYRDTPGSMCKDPCGREATMRRLLHDLDVREAWDDRWWLRRKAYSYMLHSCACAQAGAGNHAGAVWREMKALAWYPWPFAADEVHRRWERPKRLGVNLLRMLRLRRPAPFALPGPVPQAPLSQDGGERGIGPSTAMTKAAPFDGIALGEQC